MELKSRGREREGRGGSGKGREGEGDQREEVAESQRARGRPNRPFIASQTYLAVARQLWVEPGRNADMPIPSSSASFLPLPFLLPSPTLPSKSHKHPELETSHMLLRISLFRGSHKLKPCNFAGDHLLCWNQLLHKSWAAKAKLT